MRRHGSYRRRHGIGGPPPLAREPLPRVLRDESGSPALPLISEGEALRLTTSDGGALPLIHGEVEFEPVPDDDGLIDPFNSEPMA